MGKLLENLTFKGGVHIPDNKSFTNTKAIEKAKEPETVYISLHQHVGAPCEPIVNIGDNVKVGQKIGDSKASLSVPVHSSVSGTVKGITKMYTSNGIKCDCIEIESDGLNQLDESVGVKNDFDSLSREEVLKMIRESGIVGLGGGGYPAHSKIYSSPSHSKMTAAEDSPIDTVILNGAECEPYITCDHRIMVESPEKIVFGLEVFMKFFGECQGYIAIEDNKKDAIDVLKEKVKDKDITIASMKTKYPQGDSYMIINAVTGRVVPKGSRSKDVDAIVTNVHTAYCVAEAVGESKPLYERVISVTGNGIKEPKNLLVKVGTTVGDVIEQCGGFKGKPGKILSGGPMNGIALHSLDTPIVKTTGNLLVLTEEETKVDKVEPCIKCGKCAEVCPVYLLPLYASAYALKGNFEKAEEYGALTCINCGGCSYICPSKRPLTESIRHAEDEIKARRRTRS